MTPPRNNKTIINGMDDDDLHTDWTGGEHLIDHDARSARTTPERRVLGADRMDRGAFNDAVSSQGVFTTGTIFPPERVAVSDDTQRRVFIPPVPGQHYLPFGEPVRREYVSAIRRNPGAVLSLPTDTFDQIRSRFLPMPVTPANMQQYEQRVSAAREYLGDASVAQPAVMFTPDLVGLRRATNILQSIRAPTPPPEDDSDDDLAFLVRMPPSPINEGEGDIGAPRPRSFSPRSRNTRSRY